jgi:hypothetical protein
MQSVTELPFNRFVGIETASEPAQLLRLPAGAQYLNHLGTVPASAQLALAEASSGEFLLRHFGSSGGVVPVVRRLESKFRKPANGAVTSTVSVPPEALEQLGTDLGAKGRPIVSVAVELQRAHAFRYRRVVHHKSSRSNRQRQRRHTCQTHAMKIEGIKGCYDKTRGIFYFARMCSKIRLHEQGKLPPEP